VSRATTLGDESGLNSAIYFAKNTLTDDRVRRLTHQQNGTSSYKYKTIEARDKWLGLMEKGKHTRRNKSMAEHTIDHTCSKASDLRYSLDTLKKTIFNYCKQMRDIPA
jgi:hypothetical protein